MSDLTQSNPWDELRAHTSARIALGRVGSSLPTSEVLKFGLAHAQARDAVHRPLDFAGLREQLDSAGFRTLQVCSDAPDRPTYLLRPDKVERISASRSLKELEAQLPPHLFCRTHHSYVVNLQHVVRYQRTGRNGVIFLPHNHKVDISVMKMEGFEEQFKKVLKG